MKYLKKYNLFESIKLESEFPSQEDVQEFFYDITDSSSYSKCVLGDCGYSFFTTDNITNRGEKRTQLTSDMGTQRTSKVNWINRVCVSVDDTWKNIFVDIGKKDMTLRECTSLFRNENFDSEFKAAMLVRANLSGEYLRSYLINRNILDGTIPAYPVMYLDLGYCGMDKMDTLLECLDRLYKVTGFRPIGKLWSEGYIDEDTGNLVTLLRCESLQLYSCSDIEYRNLCKIFPDGNHTKELTKRFL